MLRSNNLDQRGFTLVELLIVVIILAILAAIVVPQFASSTDDAKNSSLDTNLANVRAAIDLYYQQHGHYPSAKTAVPTACAGTDGAGLADSSAAFLSQLAYYTNAAGNACTTKSDGTDTNAFAYGPYMKKRDLPQNSITLDNALVVVATGDLNLVGDAAGKGWKFDNLSGKFIADDHLNKDVDDNFYDTH